jgi:hypothetical protein
MSLKLAHELLKTVGRLFGYTSHASHQMELANEL